ncbi:MAG: class E sortase [Candidatus Andersenbacteria bacterium]
MREKIESIEYVSENSAAYLPTAAVVPAPVPDAIPVVPTPTPAGTPSSRPSATVFIGTFVSAFMLAFGIIIGGLTVAPVVAHLFVYADQDYAPQLPLSEERDESVFDITKNPGKRLYPSLGVVENIESGNWIRIPSLDVNVPLVLSPTLEDVDVLKTLDHGAALYPNGVLPGRLGNTFIAAHSTGEPWKGLYRFAFLRINELEPGNVIHLDYDGARYTYAVQEKEIVIPTPDFLVISDRPVPTMSLMACWPLWSTQKRMLIHAELQNVTQLTSPPASVS